MKKLIVTVIATFFSFIIFAKKPSPSLLSPTNYMLVLIDYESQMVFATKNIDIMELRNNFAIVSGASKIFNIPTVVTTVAEKSFSGPVFIKVKYFYPFLSSAYVDRSTMNTWEDINAHKAMVSNGIKRIVLAGLWTSVCIVGPAFSDADERYEVYVITNACGDVSVEAHERAIQRMIAHGVKTMTSIQYLLQLQRDWALSATYKAVTDLVNKFGGAYGIGIQ